MALRGFLYHLRPRKQGPWHYFCMYYIPDAGKADGMSMFHEFAQMANSLIRNMYQAIFDRNTTAVLLDRQGRIDYIWRNIAALKEYILDISVDEIITEREPQAQCLMNAMTDDASVEEIHDIRAGQSMIVKMCIRDSSYSRQTPA